MVWNIVCDSSCDLRATDVKSESVQFETVPLRLQVGAREFLDNDQLEVPDLLQAMAAEKSASSTACPSPAAFARAFEKGDRTICFTISANSFAVIFSGFSICGALSSSAILFTI